MSKVKIWTIVAVLTLAIFYNQSVIIANSGTAVVNTASLNVRSGPGLTYPVIGSMKRGESVDILSTSNDWLEIRLGASTGWIASWLVTSEESLDSQPKNIISKVNALNIRTEPSINAAIIGQLSAGEEALMTGQTDKWVAIQKNGIDGWVYADYVTELVHQQTEKEEKIESESREKSVEKIASNVEQDQLFTVSVDALNVRKKADLKAKKVGLVHKDESYSVIESDGNWVRIDLGKKKSGWVYSFHGYLTGKKDDSLRHDSKTTVTVLTNGTNIRSSATTASEIVTRVNAGERLPVVKEDGDWYEIALESGDTAFIAKWVVTTGDEELQKKEQPKNTVARAAGTLNGLTIVIDAGHGGNDRGTTGSRGTDEKDLTLLTTELLSAKLRAAGANVVMTRESDTYVSLRKRVSIGHQAQADAFISVHYDANLDSSVTGFTTYYTQTSQKSLAEAINNGLDGAINIRNRGAQPADFLVLRENKQNAVLIELGFLSNPSEERILKTDLFREQATHGIYQGLLEYFDGSQ